MKKKLLTWFLIAQSVMQLTGCGIAGQFGGTRAQDDYYEYVNEELLESIELQATDAHWDWFGELEVIADQEMDEIIRNLLEDGASYEKGSSEQKIKDLYECVSNIQNREQTGLGPLKPHMEDRKSVV